MNKLVAELLKRFAIPTQFMSVMQHSRSMSIQNLNKDFFSNDNLSLETTAV